MKLCRKAFLPLGFKASGMACGLKKSGKLDLALFYSEIPAKAACMFTANSIPAAPVILNKTHLAQNKLFRAIIVNSGNANAFCGKAGIKSSQDTVKALAHLLQVKKQSLLVASTGIIGRKLPVDKIRSAMPGLIAGLSQKGIHAAKRAILTTDTHTKEITVKFNVDGKAVTVCGVAKGAGMIAPNMATMLCFLFTDALIGQGVLRAALARAVEHSFNCITVDGCMSTNDSVMLLANGAAGNKIIKNGLRLRAFKAALSLVCLELAKLIVRDAEGASKFITIKISGAQDPARAKKISLAIANSALFKTAMYGENPNFGRIVAAVGASDSGVQEDNLRIKVSPLHKEDIVVSVDVGKGKGRAVVYTSDFTNDYVKINAEYN